ncbi:hypothetical protein KHQ81_06170 [Mycoplasmatota bacterium]|nr:hypothetical protein KHQ81_06170 [Mycoplasmatota bacterium]
MKQQKSQGCGDRLDYLQSRYYNPEIGRFINADGIVGKKGVILSHNMYAYTLNNPVMGTDRLFVK